MGCRSEKARIAENYRTGGVDDGSKMCVVIIEHMGTDAV
jgi:hypothetical protein